MGDVVIMGAGVAGLASALTLSRTGHRVTLVERDATPLPEDPAGAFDWDRRGAPQVRHSHAFLARLRNALRDRYPDVLEALLDAGATEMDFIAMLPEDMDRTPHAGDEDLVALACRRTTFEWVLRRLVLAEDHVTLLDGRTVDGLTIDAAGATPIVTGVRLDDTTGLSADLVVAAAGRRCSVPALLARHGVDIAEEVEDTGIIYYSRFFHLLPDADWPPQTGPIGGDLGYLKYGVFPGDNRTFSITLAVGSDDETMRRIVGDADGFLAAAGALPATASHVDGRATPLGGVHVMAKLLNRRRRFTATDGEPAVLGLSAVGDSHTCTNPLYGRGCSLAFVQAELLAASLDAFPGDPMGRAKAYEEACRREILPWYKAAVAQDAANRTGPSSLQSGNGEEAEASTDPPAEASAPSPAPGPAGPAGLDGENLKALLRDGLLPAMRTDPVVVRAFLRMFNLLEPPDSLMKDWDVIGRVMTVYQDRDQRPPEPALGPDRDRFLDCCR